MFFPSGGKGALAGGDTLTRLFRAHTKCIPPMVPFIREFCFSFQEERSCHPLGGKARQRAACAGARGAAEALKCART
jgi:hypothetical protein